MVCSRARQLGDRGDLRQLGGRSRRQVDRSKCPSSADSSWEHLMSNSSKSVNSVTRMYNVPSRALRVDLRDRCGTVHDGLTRAPRLDEAELRSRPSVIPAMTRLDRQNTAPWSSILAFFMEGFALYGRHTALLRMHSRRRLSSHLLREQVLQSRRRFPGVRDAELWLSFLSRSVPK
jgi:hypothetical protein